MIPASFLRFSIGITPGLLSNDSFPYIWRKCLLKIQGEKTQGFFFLSCQVLIWCIHFSIAVLSQSLLSHGKIFFSSLKEGIVPISVSKLKVRSPQRDGKLSNLSAKNLFISFTIKHACVINISRKEQNFSLVCINPDICYRSHREGGLPPEVIPVQRCIKPIMK